MRSSAPPPHSPSSWWPMSSTAAGSSTHAGDRRRQAGVDGACALQLPAHAVDHIRGREQPRVQPGALADPAGLVGDLDPQRRAHQSGLGEPGDELLRRAADGEGHLVDPVEGRLELDGAVELLRRGARHHRGAVEPAREGVGVLAPLAEPLPHVDAGERGDVAEGVQAEPAQQRRQVGEAQLGHRQGRQERGGVAGRDDAHAGTAGGAGGLLGRERPVGDADPRIRQPEPLQAAQQLGGRLLLAAVVAGGTARPEHARARAHRLHARRDLLDGGEHRLERAGILHRVVRDHLQLRAARLRLAHPQPALHAVGARRVRAGEHERPSRPAPTAGRRAGRAPAGSAITGQSGHHSTIARVTAASCPAFPRVAGGIS